MATWQAFPYDNHAYLYSGDLLRQHWERLHAGDGEPWPADEASQQAWRAYHHGDFQTAVALGLKAETASGMNAANKAQAVYAAYLVEDEEAQQELFDEVAERADIAAKEYPNDPNTHYLHAYALERYAQHLPVTQSLALGCAGKCKASLERALALAPDHAEAHLQLAAHYAAVVAKVGNMVASLTHGASKDVAEAHYQRALEKLPDSAQAQIAYADGLLTLYAGKKMSEATALYQAAASALARDAAEALAIHLAQAELADDD